MNQHILSKPITKMDSTDESGSDDSFGSLQNDLERMSAVVKAMCEETETLENRLHTLQRPMEGMAIEQFGDALFMAASPFRKQCFSQKSPGIPGVALNERYSFGTICGIIRTHLMTIGAVQPDGQIILPKTIQTLFGTEETHITYIQLIGLLRNVLV